jgi:hypothetical protein
MGVYPITFFGGKGKSSQLGKLELAFFSEGLSAKKAFHALFVACRLVKNGSIVPIHIMLNAAIKAIVVQGSAFKPEETNQIIRGLFGFNPVKFMTADGRVFPYPGTIAICPYIEHCGGLVDKKNSIYIWKCNGMEICSDFNRISQVFQEFFSGKFSLFYSNVNSISCLQDR